MVVVLMLMVLLTMLGVAMLSLGAISVRATDREQARRVARSNARMAMSLALGELQCQLGDDRRVTADSDILEDGVSRPNMVGVWDSTAPTSLLDNPAGKAPDYDSWKTGMFRKWLVSSTDPVDTRSRGYALTAPGENARSIFSEDLDGFNLSADLVPVGSDSQSPGSMAWAVSQDGTRARMNLGGDPGSRVVASDALQAPSGPYLGLSKLVKQPEGEWQKRMGRVLDFGQAALDGSYGLETKDARMLGGDFTAWSQGLMANVVKGGLKPDLSLGFEMNDSDFAATRWDGVKNPFSGTGSLGESPLFRPLNGGAPVNVTVAYSPINYTHRLETGAAPTWQSLRSFYSLYHHLYRSNGQITAFERSSASSYWPGSGARGSETSVGPVLDRVMFFMSLRVDENDIANLVVTPVITLWNPYSVAIESEGYMVYPWMDFPVNIQWKVYDGSNDVVATAHSWLSTFVGSGDTGEGRSTQPYFFCQMTGGGEDGNTRPVHLAPGEVRVFTPVSPVASLFDRKAPGQDRTVKMKPVTEISDFHINGGLSIPMNASMWAGNDNLNYKLKPEDRLEGVFQFTRDQHNYFVTMEDSTRIQNPAAKGRILTEVQIQKGKLSSQSFATPRYPRIDLKMKSQPVAVLETYHRTAGQDGQLADLVFTTNPRQRYVNNMVSGTTFAAGPHYESSLRQVADVIGSGLQVTPDGQRSYYGFSNSADLGRDSLSFFDLPGDPMLSLGAFQGADLSDSAFGPASQFGNSWASAYLPRNTVAKLVRRTPGTSSQPVLQPNGDAIMPAGLGLYDHSWLVNTAVWDSCFMSSIAPQTELREATGSPAIYSGDQTRTSKAVREVLQDWVSDPAGSPLRNPRMTLYRGGLTDDALVELLSSPAGCREIAAHLMVEGSFNVNSTRVGAWEAVLASLRGQALEVQDRSGNRRQVSAGDATPFSRKKYPGAAANDPWNGFRALSDAQIKTLAREIVAEIRRRGPAQSLGEFVNRRISADSMGLKGALQTAIDRAGINDVARVQKFDTSRYPYPSNIPDPYTGTGTPGWLTQADLLNAMAPFITVRSDTFTIRSYGEARDASGKLIATAWYEAVVQRVPGWMESADSPVAPPEDVSPASARFGRRFEIRSFRELSKNDIDA